MRIELVEAPDHPAATDTQIEHALEIGKFFAGGSQNVVELAERARRGGEKCRKIAADTRSCK